jgi:hypothetical protein
MFNKPLIQVPIKFGLIASLLLALLFVVLFFSGRHPLFIALIYDIRLLLIPAFLFFAMKTFRDSENGGILHFWQGLTIGFITFTSIGLLMGGFIMLMAEYSPAFLDEYISSRLEVLQLQIGPQNDETSLRVFQEQIDKMPLTRPFDLAVDYFWKTVLIGIFLNIILAVVLRKQPKP